MYVKMRDFLVAVEPDVGEHAITRRDEPLIARDLADRADQRGNFFVAAAFRKIVPADIGALGNDEDMDRRLRVDVVERSEEHTSELQSLMRISYAVFCLTKK